MNAIGNGERETDQSPFKPSSIQELKRARGHNMRQIKRLGRKLPLAYELCTASMSEAEKNGFEPLQKLIALITEKIKKTDELSKELNAISKKG